MNQLVLWAEKQGFGYKTANLMQLNQLTKDLNGKLPAGYQVIVPQFYGIAAQQIEKVLYEQGVDVKTDWQAILSRVTPEMRMTHVVTHEFIEACEALAQKIEDGFSQAAYTIKNIEIKNAFKSKDICSIALKSVGFDEEIASYIEAFVAEVALTQGLITLRSTGLREDTDKVANAGGNKSCEIVRTTLAETVRNMGEVAASYLKEKSLLQRSGKDEKIFEQPQMPVLLQRVIGEHLGNPVVSCVAYSQERQGNTKGVSSLQCNYGHGKSVVDSIFPFDTYYVDDQTKASFPIIRIKTKRMVPYFDSKFDLVEVDNNKGIQTKSSLERDAQQAIHIIMMELEKAYGHTMDVELVVDQTKKIVYLVQARPIVYETQKSRHMYVAETVTFDPTKTITTQKIYVDGAVYFLRADDFLIENNLESALKSVLEAEAQQQKNPIVIVFKEPGAITSHAGATLAGKGIILLQLDDIKPLEKMRNNKVSLLLLDSQRGILVDVTSDNRFTNKQEAQLLKEGLLKDGWYNHPIPAVISVSTEFDRATIETALSDYIKRNDRLSNKTVSALLDLLKEAPQNQAHIALESIIIRVAREIDTLQNAQSSNDVKACLKEQATTEALTKLKTVFNEIINIVQTVEQKLSLPSRNMGRLFAVNFLEAVLHQKPSSTIVNALSLANVKVAYNAEMDFITQSLVNKIDQSLAKNRPLMLALQKGIRAAPSLETEEMWIEFINQSGKMLEPEELNVFIEMVNTIDELGALPTWIYARVAPEMAKQSDIKMLTGALIKEFADSKMIITKLQTMQKQLQTTDYSSWQDPKKFEKNISTLKTQFLDYVKSQELLSLFSAENKNTFARMIAVSVMHELVDVFDKIIKTVKSNVIYTNDVAKAKDFKVLLHNYFELLNSWANAIPEHIMRYQQFDRSLDKYLENLCKTINDLEPNAAQLLPSPQFDVRAASLGGATNAWGPRTLEDCFTTIHQSLEITLQSFSQNLVAMISLPELIKKANGILQQLNAQIVGIALRPETITIFYNLPLNEHSGAFQLVWKKYNNGIDLTYNWYGGNSDRWTKIIALVSLVSDANDILLDNIKLDEQLDTTRFTQHLADEKSINTIAPMIGHMVDMTFYRSNKDFMPYLQNIAQEAIGKKRVESFKSLLVFEDINFSDFYKDKEERWDLATKTIFDDNPEIREGSLRALNEFADDSVYSDPLWVITQRAVKDPLICHEAFNILKKYANKQGYQDQVFKIAKEFLCESFSDNNSGRFYATQTSALEIIKSFINTKKYEPEIYGIAEKLLKRFPSQALGILEHYINKEKYEANVFKLIQTIDSYEDKNAILTILASYAQKNEYADKVFVLLQKDIGYRWAGHEQQMIPILDVYAEKEEYSNKVFALLHQNKELYTQASNILQKYAQKDACFAFKMDSLLKGMGAEISDIQIGTGATINYRVPSKLGGNFYLKIILPSHNNQELLLVYDFSPETTGKSKAIIKLLSYAHGIAVNDDWLSITQHLTNAEQFNEIAETIKTIQQVYGHPVSSHKEAFDFVKDHAKRAIEKEPFYSVKALEGLGIGLIDVYDNPEDLFRSANALNREVDFYMSHSISNILKAYAQKEGYEKQVFELAKNSYNNWPFDVDLRNTAFTIICSYANKEPYQAKVFELIQDITLNNKHGALQLQALDALIKVYGDLKNYKALVFKIIRKSETQVSSYEYYYKKRDLLERYKTKIFNELWASLSTYQKLYKNIVGTSHDEMIEEFLSEQ